LPIRPELQLHDFQAFIIFVSALPVCPVLNHEADFSWFLPLLALTVRGIVPQNGEAIGQALHHRQEASCFLPPPPG
jgi:hypothetical protein